MILTITRIQFVSGPQDGYVIDDPDADMIKELLKYRDNMMSISKDKFPAGKRNKGYILRGISDGTLFVEYAWEED